MKYIALIFSLFFVNSLSVFADEDVEKNVNSKITDVTVFMQGAQITRSGYTAIPKGNSTLVLEGVSPYINQQSIKASGKGKFTILDVQYRYVYPETPKEDNKKVEEIQRKIDRFEDSVETVAYYLANVRAIKKGIDTERGVLLNHPLLKGGAKPDSLDLLKGTLVFMQNELKNLADRYLTISLKEAKIMKEQNDRSQRIYELRLLKSNLPKPPASKAKHQVLVNVTADGATNGTVEISYKVNQAGWSPWYDITAKDAGDDIELVYKAAVYQNTGEDWSNVKLRISNANPNRSNTKPMLPRWYIDYHRKMTVQRETKKKALYLKDSQADMAVSNEEMAEMSVVDETPVPAQQAYEYTQKMQNFSSVEFDISIPYYIKSNAKTHFVTVQKHVLKAEFQHYLVPKLDKDAFVMARIVDWENLDLLIGSANIYFGNTFVGRTVIDPSIVSDTLEVSLGRYRSLAVQRTKLKDETKKKIIGPYKVYTATYQIELRNNGANDIKLVLEDQVPLTRNTEIEIELIKADGGTLNEHTGQITWDFTLNPYKKKTIVFTYTVKYPKEEEITGL